MNIPMIAGAQFTSESTAADATICLGFVPDVVVMWKDTGATNPDIYVWHNTDKFSELADADSLNDDAFLLTGSSGVVTVVDDAIRPHTGNTEVVASTDEDTFLPDGSNLSVGDRTSAGIEIDSTIQTNSAKNIIWAFRVGGMVGPVVA